MTLNKKNRKWKKVKKLPFDKDGIVIYRRTVPAEETLFPEKVEKANELLSKVKFLPR